MVALPRTVCDALVELAGLATAGSSGVVYSGLTLRGALQLIAAKYSTRSWFFVSTTVLPIAGSVNTPACLSKPKTAFREGVLAISAAVIVIRESRGGVENRAALVLLAVQSCVDAVPGSR